MSQEFQVRFYFLTDTELEQNEEQKFFEVFEL